ncbi:hypothetical protein PMG11_02862 [Penicillium brasilianum]|uniref:Uncharacterized protein n=1 Tax=Penicillium brasilianum TaxID=104259 RepID=A0A0F7TLA1_PENBI|nr:hypothetical protein PMG11_02862 [Penicillium brasilianum]
MLDNLRLASGSCSFLPSGWEVHGLAQSSWIEDYRVHRAIWCLQVFSDLYRASSSKPVQSNTAHGSFWGGWNWSQFEIEESLLYPPLRDMHEVVEEEIQTVAHVLQDRVASNQVCVAKEEREIPYFPSLEMKVGLNYPTWPARSMPANMGVDTWKRGKASTRAPGIDKLFLRTLKETFFGSYSDDLNDTLPHRGLGIVLWGLRRLDSIDFAFP